MNNKHVKALSDDIGKETLTRLTGATMDGFNGVHASITSGAAETVLKKYFEANRVYFILEEGTAIQSYDEWYSNGSWHPVWDDWVKNGRIIGNKNADHMYRRPFLIPDEIPEQSDHSKIKPT